MYAIDIETYDPNLKELGDGSIRGDGYITVVGVHGEGAAGKVSNVFKPDDEELKAILRTNTPKVMHNGVYDMTWLVNGAHLEVNGKIEDTMTREALLDEYAGSYSLDQCCQRREIEGKDYTDTVQRWWVDHGYAGNAINHFDKIPLEIQAQYCIQDCRATYNLFNAQQRLIEQYELQSVNDMEADLYPILMHMKKNGVRINTAKRDQYAYEWMNIVSDLRQGLEEEWGIENISSPVQLRKFFNDKGIHSNGLTATGNESFDSDALKDIDHEAASVLREARKYDKAYGTFINGYFTKCEIKGRIHPTFKPTLRDEGGTITGRFCIAKGTMVSCVNGEKPIEEVKAGDLLYTYDETQKLTIRKAMWAGPTGVKKCVRVTWQGMGSGDIGELICTPDHQLRTRDRGYVMAKDLEFHDSILHVHRGMDTAHNRPKIYGAYYTDMHEQQLIKREWFKASSDMHIHHINGDTMDNRIENLQVMTHSEHGKIHADNIIKNGYRTPKGLKRPGTGKRGRDNHMYIDIDTAGLIELLREADWIAADVAMDYKTFMIKCIENSFDYINYCRVMRGKKSVPTEEEWRDAIIENKNRFQVVWMMRRFNICYETIQKLKEIYGTGPNHWIVDVSWDGEYECYDIEVEDTHNFIANELCVHNSGSNPNMQNIPADAGTLGPEIRSLILPDEGHVLGAWDYKQIEYVVFIHYAVGSGAEQARQAIRDGVDYHSLVAKLLKWDTEERQKAMGMNAHDIRKLVKQKNFSVLYGMGLNGFVCRFERVLRPAASALGFTVEQYARMIDDQYNRMVPFVKPTCAGMRSLVESKGYMRSVGKRIHRLPQRKGSYAIVNYICQGGASDILKAGLVKAWRDGVFDTLRLHMTVHDENVFSIPPTKAGLEASEHLAHCMCNALTLKVPIRVDMEAGENWASCSEQGWEALYNRVLGIR